MGLHCHSVVSAMNLEVEYLLQAPAVLILGRDLKL